MSRKISKSKTAQELGVSRPTMDKILKRYELIGKDSVIRQRAEKGSKEKYLKVLAKVPDTEPLNKEDKE